jgi:hypothetical protein
MKKIIITLDGEDGILAESKFSKEELETAAAAIYEDAQKHDIYLDEEQIIKELEKKGYFKTTDEEVAIIQFYL